MVSILLNENRTFLLALIASSLIHGLILVYSAPTFIQHAQFSVQPSAQMVEVSVEEIKDTSVNVRSDTMKQSLKKDCFALRARNDTNAVHSISGVQVKANPDYFQNPSPEYPELAKQMRQEGLVMLSVDVNKSGEALKVEIIQSSGYRLLDQAALKAVRNWKFQPGSVGNIPIESTVTVPIRFRLEK